MARSERGMNDSEEALHIVVCLGSSCFTRGNNRNLEVIQSYLAERKVVSKVEVTGHLCAAECKRGPNLMINGTVYHEVDPVSVIGLLNHHLPEGNPWTH